MPTEGQGEGGGVEGEVRAAGTLRAGGKEAKLLEQRLLVGSRQVHTESGKHVSELLTWEAVAAERDFDLGEALGPQEGRGVLEARIGAWAGGSMPKKGVPWS